MRPPTAATGTVCMRCRNVAVAIRAVLRPVDTANGCQQLVAGRRCTGTLVPVTLAITYPRHIPFYNRFNT
jgi:hypothetical protein